LLGGRAGIMTTVLALGVGVGMTPRAFAQESGAGGADDELEMVVVTAQFRKQNIQDTPLAITAVTADMLEARSETNIVDVAAHAPNVRLTPGSAPFGPSLQAHIRGVGQHDFNFALEPGVGLYVDDVYYSTLTGSVLDLLDVERVEVLRGPQGTLAGQNSIGGAVKIYSRQPDGKGGGYAQLTYGSFDRVEARAAQEFSLVPDKLFMRLSGVGVSKDGYVTRYDYACTHPGTPVRSFAVGDGCKLGTEGGRSYVAGRMAARWLPGDRVEVNISGDYTADNSEASPFTLLYVGTPAGPGATPAPNTQINGVSLGTAAGSPFISHTIFGDQWADDTFSRSPYVNYATYADPAPVDGTAPFSVPAVYQVDSWGGSGTIDIDISESFKLKSISSVRGYTGSWGIDEDGSPIGSSTLNNYVHHRAVTEELRLNGEFFDAHLHTTLGAFYIDAHSSYDSRIALRTLQFTGQNPATNRTYAGFFNADWQVTDALSFGAGVRYSDIKKVFSFGRGGTPGSIYNGGPPPAVAGLNGISSTFEGDRWDWRAFTQYRWAPWLMTYAQVATGFRSGGVNPRPFFATQALPHDPETMRAYEIGAKSDFFDNRLRLNFATFLNKYEDILFATTSCPLPGSPATPCFLPINAGTADIRGYELEISAEPVEGFLIDASASTLDFEYTSIDPVKSAGAGITLNSTAPFAPELMWSFGTQYEIKMGGAGSLTPRVDVNFQDSYYTTPNNSPFSLVPDRRLVNARLTWRSADESWSVAVEGTNLTDEVYYLGLFDNRGSTQTVHGYPAAPRTWAVSLKHSF
jgi:iron complex outermembrane recepter protein